MLRRKSVVVGALSLLICCMAGVERLHSAVTPATQPAVLSDTPADDLALQRDYADETGDLAGERSFKDGVLTITLPRNDLWVQADMGEIPTGAGVASTFYFFRCSCGKDRLVGQFVLADYEVNDVIDALRNGQVEVVGVSPMFMGDKPRMMELRFQAEGKADALSKTLKSALEWVGDARSVKQPIALRPTTMGSDSH